MERLTQRNGDYVEYLKDGEALPHTLMSSYDIQCVLERLAKLENDLESGQLEPVRYGHWICNIKGRSSHIRECSVCGHHQGHGLLSCCPECRAIMRSKQKGVTT